MKKVLFAVIACFALSLGNVNFAAAQATSGDLVGTVKDSTGAILPSATVKVTAEATGVTVTTQVTSAGEYRTSNLLPGKYDVTVTASGFQTLDLKGVEVELSKTSTANVTLTVGASQSVEVTADAGVVLDTTTTNLSQTFSSQEMADLPTSSVGLGVLNLALLSPGVASAGGIGIGTGPSVGGQRPRNNNYTIEGIDNNDKSVTGPLVYVPNDAVGNFTIITSQFAPEFGHSSGGQFNTAIKSGTNKFHGGLYEYFENKELNAESGIQGGKSPNPRYDNNRYGAYLGGPILKDKLFFFGNFERNTIGQNLNVLQCEPTAAGLTTISSLGTSYGFSATNLAQYLQYTPAANVTGPGGTGIDASVDNACFEQASGPQFLTLSNGYLYDSSTGIYDLAPTGTTTQMTNIPLGNYQLTPATYTNNDALVTGVDYTLSAKDNLRGRYIFNKTTTLDTASGIPIFFTTLPFRYHLIALSEYHTFTPSLTNEFRLGYNRYTSNTPAGNFVFPGLGTFPNLVWDDQDIEIGPDGNAPQSGIQNLYQVTNNVSWVKGKHTFKVGFDGRKFISPQTFTQRVRGDYEWDALTEYMHDLAPTSFGQRSTGNVVYYGDQTALYGYVNDTWRASSTLTLNVGLRYEFTAVPVGERAQVLNVAASVPGLINFGVPQPAKKNFAPRVGINWAPDSKTSVRAGFGVAYDVLFDNLGLLSFPPQYSSTNTVGVTPGIANPGDPNFLKNGGLPSGGTGINVYPSTPAGLAAQRSATSAFVPNQVTPYAETYTLTIQRTIGSSYTAEIGYVGTRGIHLPTQDQLNIQPKVTAANQLITSLTGATTISTSATANTLAADQALSRIVPAFAAAGFNNTMTSYQPYSQSNYNGLVTNLTKRMDHGLLLNLSYTWSKTMDDATAEVFATVLTPRRQQNSQCIACDYSRSALDRTHRITLEALYDLPLYKHSNSFILKNLVGNWEIAPIYTYESPEYATVLSGDNANLNGDSGAAIDRTIINPLGVKGTGSKVTAQYSSNPTLVAMCGVGVTQCTADLVGYVAVNPNAYYIQAGLGTLPTSGRNTLPIRPIDNVDLSAYKRFTAFDHYSPSRAAAPRSCSPSTLKRRCAAAISTTRCRSSSAAPSPTSATASSPCIAASSTACRRWASSSTRSTPSPPRSSATSWATTTPTATPPSTTPWSASRSPSRLRYPMVDGQGNFGSVDGDPPAAMRYTESRLTRIAGEMLADIDSDTVDFVPNYDESTLEPTVLPARIPNLIVNGSSGIAVGMATNIPPHNLTEVLNAAIALLTKVPQEGRDPLRPRPRPRARPGPRLPHRRLHLRQDQHPERLPHRPRPLHDARQVHPSKTSPAAARPSSSPRSPTRSTSPSSSSASPSSSTRASSPTSPATSSATSPTATACASSSASSAAPSTRSSSTSSTSTPRCRSPSP
jgi:hypothetical protein